MEYLQNLCKLLNKGEVMSKISLRTRQADSASNNQRMLWCMRWVVLILFTIAFLISIAIIIITKDALTLGLPGSLLLAMRPIIRWLFPQDRRPTNP